MQNYHSNTVRLRRLHLRWLLRHAQIPLMKALPKRKLAASQGWRRCLPPFPAVRHLASRLQGRQPHKCLRVKVQISDQELMR